jgi:DNA-binding NarL/FixJ family response regulator
VAIVNDYDLVVAGIAAVLQPFRDRVELVELVSGQSAKCDVDVVLYDTFSQPQGDALDLTGVLAGPPAKMVVFSWTTDEQYVRQALAAGARGFVTKSATAEELVDALERVRAGEQVVSVGEGSEGSAAGDDTAAEELATVLLGRWPGDHDGLSPRESEVLALICQGLTNDDIARSAYITLNTVKTHIRSLYRKIDVTSRSQAVRWGLERGFAPDRTRVVAPGGS